MKKKIFYPCFISFFLFALALFSSEEKEMSHLEQNIKPDINIIPSLLDIPLSYNKKTGHSIEHEDGNSTKDMSKIREENLTTVNSFQTNDKNTVSEEGGNNKNKTELDLNEDETNKSKKQEIDLEFASIQVSGLTVADGDRWYFEEYDEYGNVVGTIFYEKEKMLAKSTIEYSDGKKLSAVFVEPKKLLKLNIIKKE